MESVSQSVEHAEFDVVSPARQMAKSLLRSRLARTGLVLLAVVCLAALLAPALTDHDPMKTNIRSKLQAPSRTHLLGTDCFGRDVLSRILYGARISLRVGFSVAAVSAIIGTMLGLFAGWDRRLDSIIMRVMDGLMVFPAILLAIAIMAVLGPSEINLIMSIAITQIPGVARVARSSVLSIRESGYVEGARSAGASDARIILKHILPNCVSPLIIQVTLCFSRAVLSEAGLSFVGAGIPPPTPSWGSILTEGREYIRYAPWLTLFPGLALVITVLGLNLLGDGLRDILDPRVRGR
jgi:peptide/nickel transport system permease protein